MGFRSYEEMGGSGNPAVGGSQQKTSPGPSDSPNGLKFGQKIYFGNVGIGDLAKSRSGSSSLSLPPVAVEGGGSGGQGARTPRKKGRGVVQSARLPRCQVEGCRVDLSDAKAYYSRHKVCGMHSKSAKVIVAGIEQRFCQQCSRFHQLSEFDEGKRSCRRRLAGHNQRRRKPPPASLFSSWLGRSSSSIFDSGRSGGRAGGFLVDFTAYPPGTGAWPVEKSEIFLQSSADGTGFSSPISSGDCFIGVADSSRALSLLSNQNLDSINQESCHGLNDKMTAGAPMAQPMTPGRTVGLNHFSSSCSPWGFTGSLQSVLPELGQISQPPSTGFDSELEMARHSGQHCMEIEHSEANDPPTFHVPWSL
ncbi:hypothetical protein Nepgr_030210 [Nepenthes gracilis]|uniref:SBP-type domain-containing protein n=1 Tax=Nepenthes gracilis TaxID=150966 RepID=A0AAD3TGN6_NEPGR|nr:hypothetical protein Nepgr_030210 [Nepenthes gracilis]